jgi:hypothetical protein
LNVLTPEIFCANAIPIEFELIIANDDNSIAINVHIP